MVLDASNIEDALKEHEVLMLEFFAGWCGNCKRLKPRYARAADELAAEGIRLAKVCKTRRSGVPLASGTPWRCCRACGRSNARGRSQGSS